MDHIVDQEFILSSKGSLMDFATDCRALFPTLIPLPIEPADQGCGQRLLHRILVAV